MKVMIESNARPCPGVERAIEKAEELLRRDGNVFLLGQLIHNQREIDRLKEIGLIELTRKDLSSNQGREKFSGGYFLIRTHGELDQVINEAKETGLEIVDATCPIVKHSHELIYKHVREGWEIVIVGNRKHQEVVGLMDKTNNNGVVVSNTDEAKNLEIDNRALLIAQTTIDPDLFSDVRKILVSRFSGVKVIDTTCRFLGKRKKQIKEFALEQNLVILVGGRSSSNCELLYRFALKYNKNSYKVEKPDEIIKKWFKNGEYIGITGGASTPRWQLAEVKSFLENNHIDKNLKGLKNNKGGTFLWWMWKKKN